MSTYKIRSQANFTGAIAVGVSGTAIDKFLAGTTSACFYQTNAGSANSGSFAVTGAAQGDIVFITGACTTASAHILSACVSAANTVTFKTYNHGTGTAAASTVTLQYLIVGTL